MVVMAVGLGNLRVVFKCFLVLTLCAANALLVVLEECAVAEVCSLEEMAELAFVHAIVMQCTFNCF
jgi:hypothetical protein